jgi:ABC-type transport system involved in multi-copper enzyme maturation permease subunit
VKRVSFSPGRVWLIAENTLREAARQRLLLLFPALGLALVLGAQYLRDFNFGAGELRFITDFGFGALALFGSALSIAATASLFWGELEQGTAHTLLAKPVWRLEFLLGKYLGVAVVLAVFCALLTGTLMAVLATREAALLREGPDVLAAGGGVRYAWIAAEGFLALLKLGMLAAFTLLIGSFAQSQLFTVFTGLLVLVVCHLQFLLQEAYERAGSVAARGFAGALAVVFPDFQRFTLDDLTGGAGAPDAASLVRLAACAAAYVIAALGLAGWLFHRREI